MLVRGTVKGNILSRGPLMVRPEAEIRGDVTAPALAVGAGAVLDGKYDIRPEIGKGQAT
jgi:cytoskeletal protein CcmA (bactofilin family)